MNTAKKNQVSAYKMALSKDMNSILLGRNEFIDRSLVKNLYWSEPVSLNYIDGNFESTFEYLDTRKVLIVEVCQSTARLAMKLQRNKLLETYVVLVFTEMSRDLIIPFLKTNNQAYLTTDLNDSNVVNLLGGFKSNDQSYSSDIINFLSYLEI